MLDEARRLNRTAMIDAELVCPDLHSKPSSSGCIRGFDTDVRPSDRGWQRREDLDVAAGDQHNRGADQHSRDADVPLSILAGH